MNFKNVILIIPIIFLIVYFGADVFYDSKLVIFVKPFIIPSFIIYTLSVNYKKIAVNFYYFAFLFYCGETFMLFGYDYQPVLRLGLISYLLCYLSLVLYVSQYLDKIKVIEIFKGYTLFVFILNIIFFGGILYILLEAIDDVFTNFIVALNTICAILLLICSVLYLSLDGTKNSYLFFFGTIAIITNDIFSALETYYLESSILNILERILHFVAFLLFYMFFVGKTNQNRQFHKIISDN